MVQLHWIVGVCALLMISSVGAQEKNPAENPDAARSVHLAYPAPETSLFYNEVTVEQSVPGSYFMACGFNGGYFGIQQLDKTHRVAIFSVWDDSVGDDPTAVTQEKRVEVLSSGAGVEVSRFGGEGTGGKSLWPLSWSVRKTYRFLVSVKHDVAAGKTTYSAWIGGPDIKGWQPMATFRTRSNRTSLQGLYSFVEDFRRDGKSLRETRRALFGNGWIRNLDNRWMPLSQARFTADGNTHLNINAGLSGGQFFLQTGGDTRNTQALRSIIERPLLPVALPPQTMQ